MRFIKRPPGLNTSSDSSTSYFSTQFPEALFVACLMEAEQYLKADDRYEAMKTKYYNELLSIARLELRSATRMGDYTPYKPAAEPTG